MRALQSGSLSRQELKNGIIISIFGSFACVVALLYTSFGIENIGYFALFTGLGVLSIWAAIKYTVGESAYGYRGLGDVFVFIFFGLIGVLGSMFLYTKVLIDFSWLPAITIGAMSVGVLNLNNLRDFESDKKSNKNTVVVKMGFEKGKIYHYTLLVTSFVSMLVFILFNYTELYQLIPLIAFVPVAFHLRKVYRTKEPYLLDPELKKLALSTFLLAVLFYIAFN
jgi:1,4-dihydroxy-2-naphthoate octaprenyltransferase